MKKYYASRIVDAQPMTRGDYCHRRGWAVPADEFPGDHGYLITIDSANETWAPRGVFEKDHRELVNGLPFGAAIEAMRNGRTISRAGWNGKGMYLYLVGPGRYPPSTPAGHAIAAETPDGLVPYLPYIAMKTVTGEVVPWLASQTDVLADDWVVLP